MKDGPPFAKRAEFVIMADDLKKRDAKPLLAFYIATMLGSVFPDAHSHSE